MFVWMGRNTSLDERKAASGAAEVLLSSSHILYGVRTIYNIYFNVNSQSSLLIVDLANQEIVHVADRPNSHIIRVIEGFETVMFRSKFESWPQTANVAVSEDGRSKVAGQ